MQRSIALGSLLALCACGGQTAGPAEVPPAPSAAPGASVAESPAAPVAPATLPSAEEPAAASAAPVVYEPLTEEKIRVTVREHYDRIGQCYASGLQREPALAGTIEVHLSIDDDGSVLSAQADKDEGKPKKKRPARKPDADSYLTDPEVVGCVEAVFKSLRFAPTMRGLVNIVYPVVLRTEQ